MIDLGDLVPLGVEIRDASSVLTNASSVVLTITLPDGTTVTPVVSNPPAVTGQYTVNYQTTQAGRHVARWVSTSPAASYVDTFDVGDPAPRGIFSLAEAKAHLNITSSRDDEEIREMIEAITAVIERHRGECVVRRTITERNVSGYGNRLVLLKHPVISVSSILDWQGIAQDVTQWTIDYDTGTLTNYRYRWYNGRDVTVTYVAGYQEVPANYMLAAKIILGHIWTTQRIQNIGQQVTLGTRAHPEELVLTPAGQGFAIPARAIELLGGRAGLVV